MTRSSGFFALFVALSLGLAGCSAVSPTTTGASSSASADGGGSPSSTTTPSSDGGTGSTNPSATGTGNYIIVLQADQTPVAVDSASSGETPSDQRIGFLGLQLLQSATDSSPLTVANFSAPVDVGYNDGDETIIATVPAKNLRAGHFTVAQAPIAYVRFTVAGTYHTEESALPGNFSNDISMANGTTLDGASRDQGFWELAFSAGGTTYGMQTGENAAIAQPGAGSGIALDTTNSPSKYVFSTDLDVDPNINHDVRVVFHVNTYQDFRWQDQSGSGYASGVFDVSTSGFESVTQLGANSISTTIE